MSWLISLCVALLAGVIAFGSMIFVSAGFVEWFHISSREGASGYFMVTVSLLGGLIGAVVALIVARQTGAEGMKREFLQLNCIAVAATADAEILLA